MNCWSCGVANAAARKFCLECGAPLTGLCPACGAANEPAAKFCGECGGPLTAPAPDRQREAPVAERRVVSVLFADLVDFTRLSAARDAEETRELLSRYFEAARRLVERYGGVLEKFIGDAVMAVWGAPTANEDDAERAVRTALDLVAAVTALGDELGLPDLRLRAGVLTGEAAVTLGAEGQGLVAGDLVNTASRIQSAAAPREVLVGEATRRASEAAIRYEDAGPYTLKGKDEPLRLYRALRVIAARRGEGRTVGLDPPFVGREREFRLVAELFHASAEERRARLVSVVGVAGVGKTRLTWEFEKHIDGLAFDVLWHRGRCLAYGEGVAFSALAEMVRMRARIAEDDTPDVAAAKLAETLAEFVPDPAERSFLEPRLGHLLGLAERSAPDKEDLFSAWRLFVERMAEVAPVVLVFEDMQWADDALLDFVDYLLDWSRAFPVFVLALARPELVERRPTLGAGQRDFTSLVLDPLENAAIDELLVGLAPGLPDELRAQIGRRAEGVPLYAVETVRMLLDRGLLERSEDGVRLTRPIDALDVPETLHALVAARLDGLEPAERRLVEDGAVLGETFSRASLLALSRLDERRFEPLLQALLRKEILRVQHDPLSPERGHLSFVQDLIRRVAYETLSLQERKRRHLAVAEHFVGAHAEDEVAAVLAAHYLAAYQAGPNDADGAELRTRARDALARAGDWAMSLAAAGEASRYYAQAAELADEPRERAASLVRAGQAAGQDGQNARAHALFDEAITLLQGIGDRRLTARAEARLADLLRMEGRVGEALAAMQTAYDALAGGEPDADFALVAAQLARLAYFAGKPEQALAVVEAALDVSEALELPEPLAEALNTKGCVLFKRPHESEALLRESLRIALDNGLTAAVLRAQFNLSGLALDHDRLDEARSILEESLALARRRGDRTAESYIRGQLAEALAALDLWDEALATLPDASDAVELAATGIVLVQTRIELARGMVAEARATFDRFERLRQSEDMQSVGSYLTACAAVARAEGRPAEALTVAAEAEEIWRTQRGYHYAAEAFVERVEAAFDLGDLALVEELVAGAAATPAVERRAFSDAQLLRFRSRLAAARGTVADEGWREAATAFRALERPFWVAVTLLEHGEALAAVDRGAEAEPLLAEAGDIFAALRAAPWVERVERAARPAGEPVAAT